MAQSSESRLSRRGFLAGSAALGAVGGGTAGYLYGRREAGWAQRVGGNAWDQLAKLVTVVRPWDPGFEEIVLPNNLRYALTIPQGVARVKSAADVANSILWAREYDVPLVARTGGHSYAGFSTTEGLMIDTTLMNGGSFDASNGRVTVQGGILNGGVYELLARNNVAITHGRCPSVGGAGFLLGGGIGFNMRERSIASDQMLASTIVKADGKRLDLSGSDELFWACRGGGGGNFGINTSFTLQTFAVPALLTVFKIQWSKAPERVAAALVEALESAPLTLGSRISLGAVTREEQREGKDVIVSLLGQFKGAKKQLLEILAPVYAVAQPDADPDVTEIIETTYWQGQKFLSEDQPPTFYQERSAFVNSVLSEGALATGFKHLREWPGTGRYCDLRFFQTGGAMNTTLPGATAFVHRESHWLMVVGLYWTWADNRNPWLMSANHDWQNAFYDAMLPYAGGGAYQNFVDPSLRDYRTSYYGPNYLKLHRIKRDVDPANVFHFKQEV